LIILIDARQRSRSRRVGIIFVLGVAGRVTVVAMFEVISSGLRALSLLTVMPVNRLTTRRLQAWSVSRFVTLARGDAITQFKLDLRALRDQLRATEKDLAVKTARTGQAERALADKESELARLAKTLDERSMQEDVQRTEIVALRMQVETLQVRLAQAGEAIKAAEECRDVTVCTLSGKESELARLATAFDEHSTHEALQKNEIRALWMQVEALQAKHAQASQKAKAAEERHDVAVRTLSEKESELARLTAALDERSVLAESQKVENAALTMQVQMLSERLTEAEEEARTVEEHRNAALRVKSEMETELTRLTSALEERSVLVDTQNVENAALRTQVRAINERLIQVSKETRAVEESLDVERSKLKTATQNLMEERGEFEKFHRRAVELVQKLTVQRSEDKAKEQRGREDLEDRLAEQSRLLNESESELKHWRGEIEVARRAEDDLRIAIIEIDGRANATIENLIAEKGQLQAALDRANGERVRLVHELTDLKRRQADEFRSAASADNAALREGVNNIAAERARRVANGRLPRREN
jgi:chromosome segregation ATPase